MNSEPITRPTDEEILRARAELLAREAAEQVGATIEVLEFGLAHERYAVETSFVTAVHPFENLTPLPGTPPFHAGIVNIRGHIRAVLDIKKFFDLPERGITDTHQIILVRGNDMEIGILADHVTGMHRVPLDRIGAPPATLTGIHRDYLKGVTDETLVLLDMACILNDGRIVVRQDEEI